MPSDDEPSGTSQFDESEFPDLDLGDRLHLERQLNLYGRERVVGWLKAKTALPTRLELEDDPDEEAYYEAFADYLIISDGDANE